MPFFDNCTFKKKGGWFTNFSTKWTFDSCMLYQCSIPELYEAGYGIVLRNCTLVSMQMPELLSTRSGDKVFDHMNLLRKEWRIIDAVNFINCQIPPTIFWCSVRSNFFKCRFIPGEAFESSLPAETVAYLADTDGQQPWDVFSNPPPKKAPMSIRQTRTKFKVFSFPTLPLPEIQDDGDVKRYYKAAR